MSGAIRSAVWVLAGVMTGMVLFAFRPVAHALPEYVTRTGEPCATCHVNPAGGGPRTIRGALWIAAGKPDKVPEVPGAGDMEGTTTQKPGSGDGQALYDRLGCGGCHGVAGEGASGPALDRDELPAAQISDVIRTGSGAMMAYEADRLSDAELDALIDLVRAMGRGELKAPSSPGPATLESPSAVCGAVQIITGTLPSCGGN